MNNIPLRKLLLSETSDSQLRLLANKLGLYIDHIVYADELNKVRKPTEKRNYSYILNLRDPAHWVGLFVDNKNHRAYYFNSFANEFEGIPSQVIDFVKSIKAVLYESDYPIQDNRRGFCGEYVVLWLYYMNRPSEDLIDFNEYLKLFSNFS